MIFNNQSALYAESVVDLSDLAEEVSSKEGGLYKYSRAVTSDGKKFNSMPWTIVGAMNAYRKSWFEEIGVTKFPETWDAYYDAGKKLKAKGRPLGQAVSHSFGDPPTCVYPLLWSFGGKEVEADEKTVTINSRNTMDFVKFMTALYKDTCDEGGLAWDDTSNNRAFLSQTISSTLNGASIYIESLRNPDKYITEKGVPLKTDILHAPLPKGPQGQFGLHTFFSHMVMSYSPNQKAAKDLLRWVHTPANYEKWFISQKGFATPPTAQWESHELWGADPVMDPFKVAGRLGQAPGFAGPAGKKAAEALTKYIIVHMYAWSPKRVSPSDAVALGNKIRELGVRSVVVKLGDQGCVYCGADGTLVTPAFPVRAVDSTAAGDTFNAALAVALGEGAAMVDALRFASAAAAISVTRAGAQTSAPSRAEVETLLARR